MNDIKLKRIGSHITKEISDICATEAHDSLLKYITLTGTEVSSDLSYAKIFFVSPLPRDHKTLEKELNDDTAGYLRTKLANRIEIRHTPKLVFKYDDSVAYGEHIEDIIEEIHEKENNK